MEDVLESNTAILPLGDLDKLGKEGDLDRLGLGLFLPESPERGRLLIRVDK